MTNIKFLSIKEASKISGKSESTLKRFIQKVYQDGKAKKDQTVDQKIKREKAPKGYFWFIAESFLQESFGTPDKKEVETNPIIQILTDQLSTKDDQIKSLLERQRETNILMKGLQDKVLFLETGQPEEEIDQPIVDQEKETTSKKGFWGKLFG